MSLEDDLYRAIRQKDLPQVKECIAAGANVDTTINGYPLIIEAIFYSALEIVKELIKAGASLNIKATPCNHTPLIMAAGLGEAEIVHYLVKAGANVHARNNYGENALQHISPLYALIFPDIPKILKKAGCRDEKRIFCTEEQKYPLNIIEGQRLHKIYAAVFTPFADILQISQKSKYEWASPEGPVRRYVKFWRMKGLSVILQFGVSLDFVPHLQGINAVRWHRTLQSAQPDIFKWSNSRYNQCMCHKHRVIIDRGEKSVKEQLQTMVDHEFPRMLA